MNINYVVVRENLTNFILTLSGPAYFEQKVLIFQFSKMIYFCQIYRNVNIRKLSKCDILRNSWNYTVKYHNLDNRTLYCSVFFSLHCMTADETAFLNIISWTKSNEMTSSEA